MVQQHLTETITGRQELMWLSDKKESAPGWCLHVRLTFGVVLDKMTIIESAHIPTRLPGSRHVIATWSSASAHDQPAASCGSTKCRWIHGGDYLCLTTCSLGFLFTVAHFPIFPTFLNCSEFVISKSGIILALFAISVLHYIYKYRIISSNWSET